MPRYVKIPVNTIVTEHALPFSVFDVEGNLLAKKSQCLTDAQVANLMRHKDLFTLDKELIVALMVKPKNPPKDSRRAHKLQSPVTMVQGIYNDLKLVLETEELDNFSDLLFHLAGRVSVVCRDSIEVALATIFLPGQPNDFVKHSLNVAMLCDLVAEKLQYNERNRHLLIAAALTMDIGYVVKSANSATHPRLGKQHLIQMGIIEKEWLDIVSMHHECNNGTGFPLGLTCDEIPLGASIINLLDHFCQTFTGEYADRDQTPFKAMYEFFKDEDARFKGVLKNVLLQITGYYPPGLVVKLYSKEIAVVIRRGKKPNLVQARCITDPQGSQVTTSTLRNTENPNFAIGAIIPASMLTFNLDYTRLWGYDVKKSSI